MTDTLSQGNTLLQGSFSGTGQSSTIKIHRGTVSLSFGSGSVTLERQGADTNWYGVTDGTWTANASVNIDGNGENYRLNCTSYTSTITYEIRGNIR